MLPNFYVLLLFSGVRLSFCLCSILFYFLKQKLCMHTWLCVCVCMCVLMLVCLVHRFVHVCTGVLAYTETRGWCQMSSIGTSVPLRLGFSLNSHTTGYPAIPWDPSACLCTQYPLPLPANNAVVIAMNSDIWLFMWVLDIITQAFILKWQGLSPLNHLFSPHPFLKKGIPQRNPTGISYHLLLHLYYPPTSDLPSVAVGLPISGIIYKGLDAADSSLW